MSGHSRFARTLFIWMTGALLDSRFTSYQRVCLLGHLRLGLGGHGLQRKPRGSG